MSETLSLHQVKRVAELARLRLDEHQLQAYREQLAAVLKHIDKIGELDVENVEPMTRPLDSANRLDEDFVDESLSPDDALANAPKREANLLAVPKVLDFEES